MKAKTLFLLALLSCLRLSLAGSFLTPDGVVHAAIAAAHQDRLTAFALHCDISAIAAHPRHPMSADALIALLRELNQKEVRLDAPAAKDDAERVTIRMTAPRRLDFDLIGTPEINGTLWRIVAIHP